MMRVTEGNRLFPRVALTRCIGLIGNQFKERAANRCERHYADNNAHACQRVRASFEDL